MENSILKKNSENVKKESKIKIHCPKCFCEYDHDEKILGHLVQCQCNHKWMLPSTFNELKKLEIKLSQRRNNPKVPQWIKYTSYTPETRLSFNEPSSMNGQLKVIAKTEEKLHKNKEKKQKKQQEQKNIFVKYYDNFVDFLADYGIMSKVYIGVLFVLVSWGMLLLYKSYSCNSGSSSKNSNYNNKTTVTEQVTSAQSQFVNAFSSILKSGYKFHALYTTKSKDFSNVYIIGGVVEKNGKYYSCIWYSNSIQAKNGSLTGLTFSFDDAAFEVSGMGKANKVNSWDDGVSRIKEKLAEEIQKIEEQKNKGQ